MTTPITYTDDVDFNTQVNAYCADLGYIGVVQTGSGEIAVNNTHFLHSGSGVVASVLPASIVTLTPNNVIFENVYANSANLEFPLSAASPLIVASTQGLVGGVSTPAIGNGMVSISFPSSNTTSGENQMVLCQTDALVRLSFGLERLAASFSADATEDRVAGDAEPFMASISGLIGDETIQYMSSDGAIATVNDSGLVTLVGTGSVTITAIIAGDDVFEETTLSFTFESLPAQPEI